MRKTAILFVLLFFGCVIPPEIKKEIEAAGENEIVALLELRSASEEIDRLKKALDEVSSDDQKYLEISNNLHSKESGLLRYEESLTRARKSKRKALDKQLDWFRKRDSEIASGIESATPIFRDAANASGFSWAGLAVGVIGASASGYLRRRHKKR